MLLDEQSPSTWQSVYEKDYNKSKGARAGYKIYNDYNKIYCVGSKSLLAIQALGKHRIRFTMSEYNYSEILLLSLETALDKVKKGGGKVLLEEIELQMNNSVFVTMTLAAILILVASQSSIFAHVSYQQRYNDGYNTGQDYAACDYNNCDRTNHGYDTGCPNDKGHTNEFCQGHHLVIRLSGIH